MDVADTWPDPLPAPIVRNSRLHEIMRDAIAAILIADGFTLRDDTEYSPHALWIVDRPHRSGSSAPT